MAVCLSRFLMDATFEDHASKSYTKAAIITDIAMQAITQHAPAAADASQLTKLTAMGLFDPAAEADVGKALDCVVKGLRAMEEREQESLGYASRGFASAEFARLVEGAVKAMLEAEVESLIRATRAGKSAREAIQDEIYRFMENVAATMEAVMGIVYRVMKEKWRAVARVDVAGRENYAHASKELVDVLDVRKKDVVYFLRYEAGDVVYGDARAKGVVVLVLLGGEKTIRIEVLAKSVVNIPARFEEVEWGGERWLRLATVKINKPKNYVVRIEPRPARFSTEVSGGASVDGLRGLLVTDASGKEVGTPDPLLVKVFVSHFKRVRVEVAGVSHTQAGPALIFRAVALDDEPFRKLFGDIAEKYGKDLWFVADKAKGMWLEVMHKLSADIKRIADEAAEVGKREGVEAGRKALVEGLRRLFEEKERAALNAGRGEEALAIAVAGRLTLGIVNSQREWFSLLVGDGAVDIGGKTFGFSAKYTEVAEAVLRLLAVWAGAYRAEIRVEERRAMFASSKDAAKVLRSVLKGDVLEYATALAKSWSGLAGADAPKLISLLALAQLLGVVEGRWAVELWLAHKAATTLAKPEATKALEGFLARVEGVEEMRWTEGGVSLYFKLRDVEGASWTATLRLYTNFVHFLLYCETYSGTTARRVLGAVAEELRPAVEQLEGRLRLAAVEWPRWYRKALGLPAGVGWPIFLKMWTRHYMSLPVSEGGRELLRVEVLEARPDGTAKFRLWYYKWRETRPHKPYVDFEIKPYRLRGGRIRLRGYVSANEAEGVYKEHLCEIAQLLREKGVEGISLRDGGKGLYFSGAFRGSVLGRMGVAPELPRTELVAVEHLGNYKFKVGGREVEFDKKAIGRTREFYAELRLSSNEEAVRYVSSLKAIGVDANVLGNVVRLDSDSFFGLLAVTNAVPPGLTALYRSDDLHVYASVENGCVRYYIAVKHESAWRVAEGLYVKKWVQLWRDEREVLEAIRGAVAKALERLGRPAEVGEPGEIGDEKGSVKAYRLYLYGPHLTPFLERAAETVRAELAEVQMENHRVVVKAGAIEAAVEFRLLKGNEAEFLLAKDVEQTLALYKSLRALGVPVEITPKGVKVDGEAMWALIAAAVEKAVEKGVLGGLSAEVAPSIELTNVYSAGGMCMYVFRAEGAHYYFAVKTGEGWRAAGGKYVGRQVQIAGEAAHIVADAINAVYSEKSVERRIEVRQKKTGVPYIQITNVDLELLGLNPQG